MSRANGTNGAMAEPTPRSAKEAPYCWAAKGVLRVIGERFQNSNKVPTARSVYLALCEIASDVQSESFRVKIALVADKAGVSYKTALEYLRELEIAGLVGVQRAKIEGSKLDAPSLYTLLPLCNSVTAVCSSDIPLCNGGVRPSVTEKG